MSKKIWYIVIPVLVLLIVWLAVENSHSGSKQPVSVSTPQNSAKNTGSATPASTSTAVKINDVDKSTLPQGFPVDVPLETGAAITYNYDTVNLAGQHQASREFISKKSADDNFTFYQKTLKDNGWVITSAVNDTARNQKIIFATKGSNNLNIRIYTDNGQVKVSLSNISGQ